jgi:hypothetical protein
VFVENVIAWPVQILAKSDVIEIVGVVKVLTVNVRSLDDTWLIPLQKSP